MAFREKTAWLTLCAMLVAYGIYFPLAALAMRAGEPPVREMLGLFAAVTIAQGAVVALGSIILAARARGEGRTPADERDRAIARRGATAAYFVLMVGMILVGVVMPFDSQGWRITNAALFALVIAETVRHGLIVASYRRGWHG
jgi:MFS family permease